LTQRLHHGLEHDQHVALSLRRGGMPSQLAKPTGLLALRGLGAQLSTR
jgi:hypothetical protein